MANPPTIEDALHYKREWMVALSDVCGNRGDITAADIEDSRVKTNKKLGREPGLDTLILIKRELCKDKSWVGAEAFGQWCEIVKGP